MKFTNLTCLNFKCRIYAAFIFSLLLITAARANPVSDAQQINDANWQPRTIKPGVVLKQAQFANLFGAPQNISIVEIDLHRKKIEINVAADPSKRFFTSQFARENNAIAAINGTFFDVKNGGSVMLVKHAGKIINTTKVRSERGGGAITIDGQKVAIVAADPEDADWDQHLNAPDVMVSGPVLIMDGKPAELSKAAFNTLSHPRSAVAITRDCKLLLVTVDGRNKAAGGMSLFSLTTLLENLNACSALNLDGGGSTTLYVKGQTENGIVNYPSDNKKFDHHGERRVANAILVQWK